MKNMTKKQLRKELKITEENLLMVMKESRVYSRELKIAVKDLYSRDTQYQELQQELKAEKMAFENVFRDVEKKHEEIKRLDKENEELRHLLQKKDNQIENARITLTFAPTLPEDRPF